MSKIYQIGSTLSTKKEPNDLDLLIVSDIPVDICLYSTKQWDKFLKEGKSSEGSRIVIYPPKEKGPLNLKKKDF